MHKIFPIVVGLRYTAFIGLVIAMIVVCSLFHARIIVDQSVVNRDKSE